MDAKVKTTNERRKEIFYQIKQYIDDIGDMNDITISGDHNQSIESKQISKFHEGIGVDDIHHKYNNVEKDELDKTNANGSTPIDSIAASNVTIEYVEG